MVDLAIAHHLRSTIRRARSTAVSKQLDDAGFGAGIDWTVPRKSIKRFASRAHELLGYSCPHRSQRGIKAVPGLCSPSRS